MVPSLPKGTIKPEGYQHVSKFVGVEGQKKDRREQNRNAQRRFRQRRKAAEGQQEHRLKLLEDAFQETLSLYINLSDVVLNVEVFSKEHPHVLNDLQRSMTRMLEIAKTVNNSAATPITSLYGPAEMTAERDRCHSVPENASLELSSSLPSDRRSCSADFVAVGADQSHSFSRQRIANSIRSRHQSQERAIRKDVYLPNRIRDYGDLQPGLEYIPPSPQCEHLMQELNFFAFRLIEITLSRAYSILLAMLSSDDVCRAFGSALRIRSREQILVDLRWLLGPGKKALPQASGYLWEGVGQEAPSRWAGCPPLDDVCLELDSDKASEISCQPTVCQSKHLTALGVVQELLNLKARVIDEDTLEITLGDQQSSDSGNSSRTKSSDGGSISNVTFSTSNNDNSHDSSTEPLKLGLSIPLLTINLAVVAVCAKVGPVYSSSEMAKAVEASIVMINRNE